MIPPGMPPEVAAAFARFPGPVQARLLAIRGLIMVTAAGAAPVGPLTEALRWGEPAYLTQATGSGTPIRLGRIRSAPDDCAVFFHCQTTMVDEFRALFGDTFRFEKNRAVIVPHERPLPESALTFCLSAALTYHLRPRCTEPAR